MARVTDRDGKSKTASAVDSKSYPEQNEVEHGDNGGGEKPPSSTVPLLDEERAKANSDNTRKKGDDSGSVQP